MIIKLYHPSKYFYKEIKNIEYLNFDFDDFVTGLIKPGINKDQKNNLICKFLIKKEEQISNENKKTQIENLTIVNQFNDYKGIINRIPKNFKKTPPPKNNRINIVDYFQIRYN